MPSPDRPVARRPHSAPSGDTYLTSDTGKQYKEENQDCMKTIKKKKGIQKNDDIPPRHADVREEVLLDSLISGLFPAFYGSDGKYGCEAWLDTWPTKQ